MHWYLRERHPVIQWFVVEVLVALQVACLDLVLTLLGREFIAELFAHGVGLFLVLVAHFVSVESNHDKKACGGLERKREKMLGETTAMPSI